MYPRILICGSRNFTDHEFFNLAMTAWTAKHGDPEVVIEGCARGADHLAEQWARSFGGDGFLATVGLAHFPADWDRHGRAAGPIRNQQMLDEGRPDAVIAFTPDLRVSRGTRDMVTRARRAGLPVWLPVAGSDDPSAR